MSARSMRSLGAALIAGLAVLTLLSGWRQHLDGADPRAATARYQPAAGSTPRNLVRLPVDTRSDYRATLVTVNPPTAGPLAAAGAPANRPENVADHDPATAWQFFGAGRGQQVELNFGRTYQITRVGLINGDAAGPATGDATGLATGDAAGPAADEYPSRRRILTVTWAFGDGGFETPQVLRDGDRQVQWLDVGPLNAAKVTLRIEATTDVPPAGQDITAIGEIEIFGR